MEVASFYPSLCAGTSILSCLFKASHLKSAISDVKVKKRKNWLKDPHPDKTDLQKE